MHNQRKTIVIGSGLGILSGFLPWANIPLFGAIDGMSGDGKITFVLFAICLAFALMGNQKQVVPKNKLNVSIGLAALASVIGIWKIADLQQAFSGTTDNEFANALSKSVSVGIGLYLLIAAGIVVIVGAIKFKGKAATAKK